MLHDESALTEPPYRTAGDVPTEPAAADTSFAKPVTSVVELQQPVPRDPTTSTLVRTTKKVILSAWFIGALEVGALFAALVSLHDHPVGAFVLCNAFILPLAGLLVLHARSRGRIVSDLYRLGVVTPMQLTSYGIAPGGTAIRAKFVGPDGRSMLAYGVVTLRSWTFDDIELTLLVNPANPLTLGLVARGRMSIIKGTSQAGEDAA